LQQGLEEWIAYSSGFFASDTWKINTGLKGLDLMVNWFIKLQYDVLDRLVMFTLCCVVVIVSFVAGEFFGFSFIDKSSNPKTPNDIPIHGVVGIVAAYALIFPIILSFFGVLILVLK
jgi:heme/copper-type cytochrome/quinol oxidase subunit 2